jgi:zinc D-Ala-D-Ala carboxypeptidase
MNKSSKIFSLIVAAVLVIGAGGFAAAYRNGKKPEDVSTTVSISYTSDILATTTQGVTETTGTTQTTENETTTKKTVVSTQTPPATTKAPATTATNVSNTGYPFNYPGIKPKLTTITADNWNIMLINSDYYLPESYNFKLATAIYPAKLDARAAGYYAEMYNAAKKEGITLNPTSVNAGYRSIDTQKMLFDNRIKKYEDQGYNRTVAVQKASKINQPPGCSEHNAGLAMDIISTQTTFADTKAFKWLNNNAADYGFILRYPEDKQAITKIMYEPWHWRFVGVEHAKAIKASGLCLEEYLEKLR